MRQVHTGAGGQDRRVSSRQEGEVREAVGVENVGLC